jgi:hypothetical protein
MLAAVAAGEEKFSEYTHAYTYTYPISGNMHMAFMKGVRDH